MYTIKQGCENQYRFKARLVAKGFMIIEDEDPYSPVIRIDTIRALLSIANKLGMYAQQMDLKTAFLNGNIKETEEVSVSQPKGFKGEKIISID